MPSGHRSNDGTEGGKGRRGDSGTAHSAPYRIHALLLGSLALRFSLFFLLLLLLLHNPSIARPAYWCASSSLARRSMYTFKQQSIYSARGDREL
ncbi:hypothetical protein GGR52DRAFT_533681 [Hypoxylon sp. FL1284]|nr:hypothetical protein GGR52DRAFT_533681 [Hypoxylon sp. FL1284]